MQITVKAARVNVGKSQKETAHYIGLSLTQYQRKENGIARFYADELAKLSVYFNVPMLNFFEAGCPKKTQAN